MLDCCFQAGSLKMCSISTCFHEHGLQVNRGHAMRWTFHYWTSFSMFLSHLPLSLAASLFRGVLPSFFLLAFLSFAQWLSSCIQFSPGPLTILQRSKGPCDSVYACVCVSQWDSSVRGVEMLLIWPPAAREGLEGQKCHNSIMCW